jgi:hypothetical protein
VPTLILERILAQKAADLDAAIAIIRKTPRMRGQTLVIGYAGDPARDKKPAAAVVRYDAETVEVQRAADGWAFDSSLGTDPDGLRQILQREGRAPMAAIRSAGVGITLHSVAIRPQQGQIWIAHGETSGAHRGPYRWYDIRALLARR